MNIHGSSIREADYRSPVNVKMAFKTFTPSHATHHDDVCQPFGGRLSRESL
jgi:hypothetical protein